MKCLQYNLCWKKTSCVAQKTKILKMGEFCTPGCLFFVGKLLFALFLSFALWSEYQQWLFFSKICSPLRYCAPAIMQYLHARAKFVMSTYAGHSGPSQSQVLHLGPAVCTRNELSILSKSTFLGQKLAFRMEFASGLQLHNYKYSVSRRIRCSFSTIPAGLPGPGLYHLVTVLPFSYLLRKPSTIWRETSRLKNSETGVLGINAKSWNRGILPWNSGSVLKMITRSETSTNQSGSAMNRPGSAAQSGSEMNRSGSLRTYTVYELNSQCPCALQHTEKFWGLCPPV